MAAKKKDQDIEVDDSPVVLEPPVEARKTPTVFEQYERNMDIIALRVRKVPWSEIADKHGLTKRRCELIFKEWQAHNKTLRHHDPLEIVDEMLYGYEAVIADLEKIASSPDTDNDSARVGALNSKLRAFREMTELLQAIGALPNDLGTLSLHIDGRITAERVVAVLDRMNVGPEVEEALLAALGGPPPSLEAGTN